MNTGDPGVESVSPALEHSVHPNVSHHICAPQELKHVEYLDHFGLVVNTRLPAILCATDGIALTNAARHLKDHHSANKLGPLDQERYDAICATYGIDALPVIQASLEAVTAYDGIKVSEGLCCDLCGFVGSTEDSLRVHHNKSHTTQLRKSHTPCSYQVIGSGATHKTKFKVTPKIIPDPPTSLEAMMAAVREGVTATAKASESQLNARAVSPWLLACGFHLHIEGFDTAELSALTFGSMDDPTVKLRSVVRTYYSHATSLLATTDVLVRQMLNSPDPQKK